MIEVPLQVQQQRDRISQGAAAADAEIARLTAEFHASPDQRAARARARLEELAATRIFKTARLPARPRATNSKPRSISFA